MKLLVLVLAVLSLVRADVVGQSPLSEQATQLTSIAAKVAEKLASDAQPDTAATAAAIDGAVASTNVNPVRGVTVAYEGERYTIIAEYSIETLVSLGLFTDSHLSDTLKLVTQETRSAIEELKLEEAFEVPLLPHEVRTGGPDPAPTPSEGTPSEGSTSEGTTSEGTTEGTSDESTSDEGTSDEESVPPTGGPDPAPADGGKTDETSGDAAQLIQRRMALLTRQRRSATKTAAKRSVARTATSIDVRMIVSFNHEEAAYPSRVQTLQPVALLAREQADISADEEAETETDETDGLDKRHHKKHHKRRHRQHDDDLEVEYNNDFDHDEFKQRQKFGFGAVALTGGANMGPREIGNSGSTLGGFFMIRDPTAINHDYRLFAVTSFHGMQNASRQVTDIACQPSVQSWKEEKKRETCQYLGNVASSNGGRWACCSAEERAAASAGEHKEMDVAVIEVSLHRQAVACGVMTNFNLTTREATVTDINSTDTWSIFDSVWTYGARSHHVEGRVHRARNEVDRSAVEDTDFVFRGNGFPEFVDGDPVEIVSGELIEGGATRTVVNPANEDYVQDCVQASFVRHVEKLKDNAGAHFDQARATAIWHELFRNGHIVSVAACQGDSGAFLVKDTNVVGMIDSVSWEEDVAVAPPSGNGHVFEGRTWGKWHLAANVYAIDKVVEFVKTKYIGDDVDAGSELQVCFERERPQLDGPCTMLPDGTCDYPRQCMLQNGVCVKRDGSTVVSSTSEGSSSGGSSGSSSTDAAEESSSAEAEASSSEAPFQLSSSAEAPVVPSSSAPAAPLASSSSP